MANFCTKCGNPLQEGMRFCTKCGAPVPQAAPVETVQQPEPQIITAPQPAPQVAPAAQSKPAPQPAPQVAPAPQPAPQPQVQYVQQPVQNININTNTTAKAAVRPAKKESSGVGRRVACIILGVVLLAEVCFGLFVYPKFISLGRLRKPTTAMENIPPEPKAKFLYFLENSFPMISDRFADIGTKQTDLFFNLGKHYSDRSYMTDAAVNILINSNTSEQDYDLSLNQIMGFNDSNGDAMMEARFGSKGQLGTPMGLYFKDGTLYCLASDGKVVHHLLTPEQQAGLKLYSAIDKFALLTRDMTSEKEVDWKTEMKNFGNGALGNTTDSDYEVYTDKVDILDGNRSCDIVSISRTGREGLDIFNAVLDEFSLIGNYKTYTDSIRKTLDPAAMSEAEISAVKVRLDAIAHRKVPVGMRIVAEIKGVEMTANIFGYYDGYEEHTEFSVTVPEDAIGANNAYSGETKDGNNKIEYIDTTFKDIGDSYTYKTHIEFNSYIFDTNLKGRISESGRDMSGTVKATVKMDEVRKYNVSGTMQIKEDVSGGASKGSNISDLKIEAAGLDEMLSQMDESAEMESMVITVKISSDTDTKFKAPDITLPNMSEGSVETGPDGNSLLNGLGKSTDTSVFENKNSFIRTIGIFTKLGDVSIGLGGKNKNDDTENEDYGQYE